LGLRPELASSYRLCGFAAGKRLTQTDAYVHVDVHLKRAYEPAAPADGYRVLIDRLWPRGLSHAQAEFDDWDKQLAPSTSLRQWFGHEPSRFEEFRRRYIDELRSERPRLAGLRRRAGTT
jgi:uncharacterized protein YeaO (DUF488 family)